MTAMRALAVLLLVGGCTPIDRACHWTGSGQCGTGGSDGSCEATGWCSFPDAACAPTGRRYATLVGDGLAGLCVSDTQPTSCVSALAVGDAHGCALVAG